MDPSYVGFVYSVLSAIAGAACMYMYFHLTRKTDVLFFPDAKLPCHSFYKQLEDGYAICRKRNCTYAHNNEHEFTSLMEIFVSLNKAKRKIDLCIFEFTQRNLADFLINVASRRGIVVRIITDAHKDRKQVTNADGGDSGKQQQQGINDQIPRLHSSGIKVKINKSNVDDKSLMHNKFVLIDDRTLLMGSFNWTSSAVMRHHEAVISTNESRIVRKFVRKFQEIWASSDDRDRELPIIRSK